MRTQTSLVTAITIEAIRQITQTIIRYRQLAGIGVPGDSMGRQSGAKEAF
jgi:hypothetical protein